MTITLCMIVKDEERVLARCLESAKGLVDEIVIVDTGSTDRTVEIARQYTDAVYFLPWRDDFAYARNFAFSKGTGDYLLWLDADDVIEENADTGGLKALLEEQTPDMVLCKYVSGDLIYYRERFLKREKNFVWQGRVHECIAPQGKVARSELAVVHLPEKTSHGSRNLDIYRKWAGEEALSGRDLFYYGRELYYHRLYTEAVAVLKKMLAGEGWYVNKIEACRVLSSCHAEQGETEQALDALFSSFRYGQPRAGVLCDIGSLFRSQEKYPEAAFWYEAATHCRDHATEGDFDEPAARTLIPMLELVVCHWNLGERETALFWHKKTEELAPEHPSVQFNRKFFY